MLSDVSTKYLCLYVQMCIGPKIEAPKKNKNQTEEKPFVLRLTKNLRLVCSQTAYSLCFCGAVFVYHSILCSSFFFGRLRLKRVGRRMEKVVILISKVL